MFFFSSIFDAPLFFQLCASIIYRPPPPPRWQYRILRSRRDLPSNKKDGGILCGQITYNILMFMYVKNNK